VRSIISIKPEDAAWYSAVAGAGAGLIGTLAVWPFMRKVLREYDERHNLPKDAEANLNYKTSGIEEDRCEPVSDTAAGASTAVCAGPQLVSQQAACGLQTLHARQQLCPAQHLHSSSAGTCLSEYIFGRVCV
jgi:hypothetical protein